MNWIEAGAVEDWEASGVRVVRGADRPIAVFRDNGRFFAVDNRCPHMGFPLDKGSVRDGILTCHWHHARFALEGGCAFDLFADDVPAFPTRVVEGRVQVGDRPLQSPDPSYFRRRLKRGLDQNLTLIQAKSIIGMMKGGSEVVDIIRDLTLYGTENHETWMDGMTLLALVARLDGVLSDRTRVYALTWASNRVAANCADRPRRRERGSLEGSEEGLERLEGWFRKFAQMRHRDGAERTLLTAAERDGSLESLQTILGAGIHLRVFADTGHLFDFSNKLLELLEYLGNTPELRSALLPLIIRETVEGMGEEDQGGWRSPVDLVELVRSAEADLKDLPDVMTGGAPPAPGLIDALLGEDPGEILDLMVEALRQGCDPVMMADEIVYAAAWRLARFSPANELVDWFNPVHTFHYTNAVAQSLRRVRARQLVPGLLHGAMAVYQDRFLNIPPAAFPKAAQVPDDCPEAPDEVLESILSLLDRVPQLGRLVGHVVAYVRRGHPIEPLVDCLAWGVIREDLDFHKLQTLEAAYRLASDTSDPERRAVIMAGATRHLGAHCPTARGRIQSTRSALKLHRGDALHEE